MLDTIGKWFVCSIFIMMLLFLIVLAIIYYIRKGKGNE